jgi:RimJ/RimL family protein N-acetyltransferase
MRSFEPKPVTLIGEKVRLEPLRQQHAENLFEAGIDRTIWTYMPVGGFSDLATLREWIDRALQAEAEGREIPFAIVLKANGRAMGATRFMDIQPQHRALEIGWTWLSPDVQRTVVNTETKYLLLTHAFEDLGAHRVQLKTDARNLRSQRAIERIGAVLEGRHRRHMVLWDGYVRDTVFYSIVDTEWPAVKSRLETMLRTQN